MLRLSKKADYALLAMRHLAAHADRSRVSARELAEAYDIPAELLAKVLQKLVRARLLESHQGIRGGYGLAGRPPSISVADVIQAIDGPLTVTACSDTDHSCDQYLEVQHSRSALADQGPDRLGAGSDVGAELAADCLASPPWSRSRVEVAPRSAEDSESACRLARSPSIAERRAPSAGDRAAETRKNMITVTDHAADQIQKLLEKQHVEARGLRVGVKAGGCSGFEYVFVVGAEPRENDLVFEGPTACACGSIRAAIACSTARRSTTTRACSAADSCSRTRTRRARAGAGRRFRS